jgi:two-component system, OmpR family, response regulator
MPHAPLILVVEDEEQVRAVIGEFLQQRGYRFSLANERSVGDAILRAARPALMITDVVLRGGSGLELAQTARTMGVPVLLISGEPNTEQLAGGPMPFLQKPFRLADLEREMERLLGAQGSHCG